MVVNHFVDLPPEEILAAIDQWTGTVLLTESSDPLFPGKPWFLDVAMRPSARICFVVIASAAWSLRLCRLIKSLFEAKVVLALNSWIVTQPWESMNIHDNNMDVRLMSRIARTLSGFLVSYPVAKGVCSLHWMPCFRGPQSKARWPDGMHISCYASLRLQSSVQSSFVGSAG